MIYVFPSLIRKGDELWLYYTSSDTTHGGRDRSRRGRKTSASGVFAERCFLYTGSFRRPARGKEDR